MLRRPTSARLRLACASIAALLCFCAFGVSLAQGHGINSVMPNDGSIAGITSAHDGIIVCDNDPDGHYAYVRLNVGGVIQPPIYDSDGYGGVCGWAGINAAATDAFNVCVQTEGCGPTIYRWQF